MVISEPKYEFNIDIFWLSINKVIILFYNITIIAIRFSNAPKIKLLTAPINYNPFNQQHEPLNFTIFHTFANATNHIFLSILHRICLAKLNDSRPMMNTFINDLFIMEQIYCLIIHIDLILSVFNTICNIYIITHHKIN